MRIKAVETRVLTIGFPPASSGAGLMPVPWDSLESAVVRVEDVDGHVGWGEGFGYLTSTAVKAVVDRLIAPRLAGSEVEDIAAWNLQVQGDLHMFGRYGITLFALSAVDAALWDLSAKRAGVPLAALLRPGVAAREQLDCYASLMRYGCADTLRSAVAQALKQGYRMLKLHENQLDQIQVARAAAGSAAGLSVDVNCGWSARFVWAHAAALRALDLGWLEEPVFPPEAFSDLASLRPLGIPIAAGENWCTAAQFKAAGDAVDIWQPSVIKVGGVSEFVAVLEAAQIMGKRVIPHSPYFGPGFFTTLQLASVYEVIECVEVLFAEPAVALLPLDSLLNQGRIRVPVRPGATPPVDARLLD